MPNIVTHSGFFVSIDNPEPNQINIKDIAHGLSNAVRFNGHLKAHYDVAQHSCHVADMVMTQHPQVWGSLRPTPRRLQDAYKAAIMHDSPEAYTGDITTHIKRLIREGTRKFDHFDKALERAIFDKFNLKWPMPEEIKGVVKRADLIILGIETQSLATAPALRNGAMDQVIGLIEDKGINFREFSQRQIQPVSRTASRALFLNKAKIALSL